MRKVLVCIACSCLTYCLAGAQESDTPIRVGVFEADKVDGQSFGETGIMQALADAGRFRVTALHDLASEASTGLDVLVLPDVHGVGSLADGWQEAVRQFVLNGGGVLLTHDCAGVQPELLFPEICGGTKRHVSRSVKPVLDHPAVSGVLPFDCRFGDHKDVLPGPAAHVLLRCAGDASAGVLGELGQGRVVHVGVALGLDETAQEGAPNEDELRLLLNAVAWLARREPDAAGFGSTLRIALAGPACRQPEALAVRVLCARRALPPGDCRAVLLAPQQKVVAEQRLAFAPSAGEAPTADARFTFPTQGLTDGSYTVRVLAGGGALSEATVLLEGQARAAMAARDVRIRARHRGKVIKFEFIQGYNFRKDWDKARPFLEALKAHGIDSFDGGVFWGGEALDPAEFERFEGLCEIAREVGLDLWATFVPPSGNRAVAAMGTERGRELYREAFKRLADIAREHPHFIGITIDDFGYNLGFFSPEFCSELATLCRSGSADLAFMPLLYWGSVTTDFMARYEPYIDGLVFHFRAGSNPASYLAGYDPKSFEDYRHVLRYELSRARRVLGNKTLICGLYQWYYKGGWGVMTPDGKTPSVEHQCRDVLQKYEMTHEYADGVRLYGLGIDRPVYDTLRDAVEGWKQQEEPWGWRGLDVEPYRPPDRVPPKGRRAGTIMDRTYGIVERAGERGWPRHDLYRELNRSESALDVSPASFPLLLVSRTTMSKAAIRRVEGYVRTGGTLVIQSVPGWRADTALEPLQEGEKLSGDDAWGTRAFARLAGVRFRYHPRGYVTRIRVVAEHPLTQGLPLQVWRSTSEEPPANNYPYLAYPAEAADTTVLIEAEHELCPYNGVDYVRKGEIRGVFPLLTVRRDGRGAVVRCFAHVSPKTILGAEWFEVICERLLDWSESRADESGDAGE